MKSFTSNRYQILQESGLTVIRRRWRSPRTLFLAGFFVLFNVFFMPDYVRSFTVPEFNSMGGWIGLVPFVIEAGLVYALAASFFNKTDIAMGRGFVQIRQYPLWAPGNKKLNAHDIEQIHVTHQISDRRDPDTKITKSTTTYYVNARDRRGRDIKLVGNIFDKAEADFIETEMEKALEIKDEPVAGAV